MNGQLQSLPVTTESKAVVRADRTCVGVLWTKL